MKKIRETGFVLGALAAAVLVGWACGEGGKDDKLPADLAHVPTKAVGLLSFRPAQLWSSDAGKLVREKMGKEAKGMGEAVVKLTGVSADKMERLTFVLRAAGPPDNPLMFVATTEKFDPKEVFARLVPEGKEMKAGQKAYTANDKRAVAALGDRAFVVGSPDDVRAVLTETPDGKSGLAPAVRLAAGKHLAVVGVDPRAFPPPPDDLPPAVAAFKPLLKASMATATFDLDKPLSLRLRAAFPDADAAAAGLKALEGGRKLGLGFLGEGIKEMGKDKSNEVMVALAKELRDGVKEGSLKQETSVVLGEVRVKIDPAVASGALLGGVMRVREAAQRAQLTNNLKQIALAFHNYASAYGGDFPAQAIYSKEGKPLLSWRVTILPYLDQQKLYEEFKLNEAWDSPHNKKLLARMPKTYTAPGAKHTAPGHTYYQGFFGKGAIFEGKRGTNLRDVTDGTSNTLLIVEAGKDVPWTKPEDLPFDPAKELPKLGGLHKGGFFASLCDGSVRFISDKVSEKTLKAMITRNGGEVLEKD